MMKTLQKLFATVLLVAFSVMTATAQSIPVTLEVPQGVTKNGETMELRTTTDGERFITATTLTKEKEGVWTGSFVPGDTSFEYRYVLVRKNGEEQAEGWAIRRYHPGENRTEFNDVLHFLGGEVLAKNTSVTLRLNLEGLTLDGNVPEAVGVMGSYGELSWNVPDGVTHLQNIEGSTWEASVAFPEGTTTDFPVKFVWEHEGVWRWESLAGFVDHLLILDSGATEYTAEFGYNPETGRIEARAGTGLEANNYALAAQRYGGTRNYEYYRAMELIDAGDYAGAQAMYAQFRSHYREPFNDDFHGYLSSVLSGQGQPEQALAIVDQWHDQELDPYRKAHYRYLKGRVLLNHGQLKESRASMQEVLALAPEYDQEAIRGHALQSIGVSYLQEEDPIEILKAKESLEQLIEEHPDPQMKRMGWQYLVATGEKAKNKGLIRRAMSTLKETGSEQQQKATKIRWVEMRLQDEELMDSTVADDLQWLEWTTEEPAKKDKIKLLKADWQLKMGLRGEAMETLLEVEGEGKQGGTADKARTKLNELDADWKQKQAQNKERTNRANSVQADTTGGGQ